MAKYLLVVADDFSACPEIDEGILRAVKAGNIDCVDCFVTFERSQEAIHNFKHFRAEEEIASGKLKMGLHVTLTTGRPVGTEHSSKFLNTVTNSNGEFHEITKLPIDRLWKHYSESVKMELQAQYDKFKDVFGAPPQHISCHEGIFHLSKELTAIYLDFVEANNLLVRNPKLISTIGKPLEKWKDGPATKMVKRAQLTAGIIALNVKLDAILMLAWSIGDGGLRHEVERRRANGMLSPHYCVDHFYGTGSMETMDYIYERMDDGKEYEIITHPVWYEKFDDFNTPNGINKPSFRNRKVETETLTSAEFAQRREQNGVQKFVWP